MTLSTLAILLGLVVAGANLFAVIQPEACRNMARAFPRNPIVGYALMGIATVWFMYNVNQEQIADFARYKKPMIIGFGILGAMTCIYVSDFLAVRGLAVIMLLLGKTMVDTARWADTGWRLVIVAWAYLLVFMGMWLTISPWRLRDMIQWGTRDERRTRTIGSIKLAFGLFVLVLGLTAFR